MNGRSPGLSVRAPGGAWVALAGGLALLGALGSLLPASTLAWSRATAALPWRWLTPVGAHYGGLHLLANLAGLLLLAWLGRAARLDGRAALAWCLAWPATHAALWLAPALTSYAGLSGVVHAGTAVAAVFLLASHGRLRWLGLALALGLALKLGSEQPWQAPVQRNPAWAFPVAVIAHATGTAAGLAAALLVLAAARRRTP